MVGGGGGGAEDPSYSHRINQYSKAAKKVSNINKEQSAGEAIIPSRHILSKSAKPALVSALADLQRKPSNIFYRTAQAFRKQDEINGLHLTPYRVVTY